MVEGLTMVLDKESLIHLICKHCEFYKESDKELEWGAYKILKDLLERGAITPGASSSVQSPSARSMRGSGFVERGFQESYVPRILAHLHF
jgi:hypothetical protein